MIGEAMSWVLADGWVVAPPDDPRMRRFLLIEDEEHPPEFADAVLAKMAEIAPVIWRDQS